MHNNYNNFKVMPFCALAMVLYNIWINNFVVVFKSCATKSFPEIVGHAYVVDRIVSKYQLIHMWRVCMAYRESLHKTTGYIPSYLMFRSLRGKTLCMLMFGTPKELPEEYAMNMDREITRKYLRE